MTALVRAENLSRRFPSADGGVTALDGVDLNLEPGRFVAVMGPSGCGKSTLLNLIGLLDRPTGGRLEIAGVDTEALNDQATAALRRTEIGFLFQDAGLIDRMSVLDNVMLPLDYRGVPSGDRRKRAEAAIGTLGLEARTSALVDTLSGGERQRVGLARILATQPRLVICDEPTASLDEANSRLVLNYLLSAAEAGALVVCASHDAMVLDRAQIHLSLARGRLVAVEGPA